MAYAKIRPRRGTLLEWSTINPILAEGELVIELPALESKTGLCKFKIGDGYASYNDLPYAFDAEAAHAIYGGGVYEWNNIYIRSGTTNEWISLDPILGLGEITFDVTQGKIKIGDGINSWSRLNYIGGNGFDMDDSYDFGDEDEDNIDPESEIYDFGDEDEDNTPPDELEPKDDVILFTVDEEGIWTITYDEEELASLDKIPSSIVADGAVFTVDENGIWTVTYDDGT